VTDGAVNVDRQCGYPVYRAPHVFRSARAATVKFKPEIVVVTQPGPWLGQLPEAICKTPMVIYENETSDGLDKVPEKLRARAFFAANSEATSAHLRHKYGAKSTIIRPIFGIERFARIQRLGENVLFVSLSNRKGSDIALRIAELRPKINFVCVETWTRNDMKTEEMRGKIRALPNVTLLANQQGLVHIMPEIKLLLMPSRGNESWGRTATEAQICGIPVIASNRGNLPITIGPGGITLDPDGPIEPWLEAFDAVMNNSTIFEGLSCKAREHGSVLIEQIEPTYQAFNNLLRSAIAGGWK
ncbi:MAG: glycosyltransferase, partial [Alphaproteobacteria bacterium]